jgi:hypothetical protein
MGAGILVDTKSFFDNVHEIGPELIFDISIIHIHVEQIPVTGD